MPVPTSVARKRRIEVAVGKYFANPLVTGLNRIGLMPSLMTEIETVGRRTGLTRRVPVAITYDGDEAWVIAQHGTGTGWGANISATPKVRIRRRGEWVDGQAQIMPDDDVPARGEDICVGEDQIGADGLCLSRIADRPGQCSHQARTRSVNRLNQRELKWSVRNDPVRSRR